MSLPAARAKGHRVTRDDVWLLVAAFFTAAPLFVVTYPPFTDLPEHVAVMASLRHFWDPAWRIQEHYVVVVRSQYALYHLAGALLTFVVGSAELANKLLLTATAIALPFTMRSLLSAFRRDRRLAIFAAPLFWSRPLVVGFLPYVASLPALLGILAVAVSQAEAPTRRRGWALAVLALLLFYLHASAYTLLGVIAAPLAILGAWRSVHEGRMALAREALVRIVWLVPSGLVAVAWALLGRVTMHGDSLGDAGEIGTMSTLRSARAFGLWSHDIWRSHVDEACAVVWWGALVVLLVAGLRARRPRGDAAAYVPLAAAMLLFFTLPFRVGAGAMLNVRIAPLLALFAILTLDPPAAQSLVARAVRVVALLVAMATGINAAVVMRIAEREDTEGLDELFAKTTQGARLLSLGFDADSSVTHFPSWLHVGAYHRARKGGVASFSFTELHHWSLNYVEKNAPPQKPEAFWDFHPCLFKNAEDGPYYDYVLVRGGPDPFRDHPPGPAWRVVATARRFTLWEKIPGELYPAWPAPLIDEGPCESRVELEAAASRARRSPALDAPASSHGDTTKAPGRK